jgi:hypothetical protein
MGMDFVYGQEFTAGREGKLNFRRLLDIYFIVFQLKDPDLIKSVSTYEIICINGHTEHSLVQRLYRVISEVP